MREVEFRGKALRSKLWVRGYYWSNENQNYFIRQTIDLNDCFRIADIEVDPETVGQYTGLKDKNGVKIYEGDIVYFNYREPQRHKIVFEDGSFWIVDKDNQYMSMHEVKEICCGASNFYIEVIGNIHNNPELLEGENRCQIK